MENKRAYNLSAALVTDAEKKFLNKPCKGSWYNGLFVLVLLVFLGGVLFIQAQSEERRTIIHDSFDTYTDNQWPDAYWIAATNMPGITNSKVMVLTNNTPSLVLQLYGVEGGCRGAMAYRYHAFSRNFSIEFDVRNGTQELSGCRPERGVVQMRKGTFRLNPARNLLSFFHNGLVLMEGNLVGDYQPGRWHRVRIRYSREDTNVVLTAWLDGKALGSHQTTIADAAVEDALDHIELAAYEGSAWFDNVSITDEGSVTNTLVETFDVYTERRWPYGDWVRDANAHQTANSKVIVSEKSVVSQALQLYGPTGGCEKAVAYRPCAFPGTFYVEFDVCNGTEELSGCDPRRAVIKMRQGTFQNNASRSLIEFAQDGRVLLHGTGVGNYQPGQWHRVRLKYDRKGTQLNLTAWLDGLMLGTVQTTIADLAAEQGLDHLELGVNEGTAWFDNLSVMEAIPYPTTLSETFESYTIGKQPVPNWIMEANAFDTTNNTIIAVSEGTSGKALKLYGIVGGCWGALAYRSCAFPRVFYLDVDIYNGTEVLSGCHPQRAAIEMREGTAWSNPNRFLIEFNHDGKVRLAGKDVGDYQAGRWYRVRIKYERMDPMLNLTLWMDGQYVGTNLVEIFDTSVEDRLNHIELAAQEGTAIFDNLRIIDGTVSPRLNTMPKLQNNVAEFEVDAQIPGNYQIESSTNLVDWVPFMSFQSAGTNFIFRDNQVPAYPQRFYRLRSQ